MKTRPDDWPDKLPVIRPDNRSGQPATAPVTAPTGATQRRGRDADVSGQPDGRPGHSAPSAAPVPDTEADNNTAQAPSAAVLEDLLPVARRAVSDAGKLTRKVVADAIRGQGLSLSNDRLTEVMQQLREEADNRTLRSTG